MVAAAPSCVCADSISTGQVAPPREQSTERLQSIESRHRQIERDHVRVRAGDGPERFRSARGLAHHPELGVAVQDLDDRLAHEGRVVHDEDADHAAALPAR